jgi:hypothetical protein
MPAIDITEFQPWPKIARLNRDIIVTEKVDGTNAAIVIDEDGNVAAQSRTRILNPDVKGGDNFGFAAWVRQNAATLATVLGTGRHFGEWYGLGIQRGYGLTERRFALFNVKRHKAVPFADLGLPNVETVPVLYEGTFDADAIQSCLTGLSEWGSNVGSGVAEGIVVFHTASSTMYKVTLENDEVPKGLVALEARA